MVDKLFANLKYDDSTVVLLLEHVDLLESCGFDFRNVSNVIKMVVSLRADQGFAVPCLTSELFLKYLCVMCTVLITFAGPPQVFIIGMTNAIEAHAALRCHFPRIVSPNEIH